MSFGWHPREHRKALDGMLMLTLEERGAYNTCLDLIYDREGPIPDDSRWLAGWMGVSSKKWATIRASLIVKGKLYEVSVAGRPCLMNARAAIELENQSNRSRKSRESGAKGGAKSAETRAKSNENNDDAQATAQAGLKLKTETGTDKTPDTSSEVSRPKKARGSRRCPEGWAPSEATTLVLGSEGHTPGDLERALTRMRDHEFRTPRSDWDATFRNWVRGDADRKPRQAHDRPSDDKLARREANHARALAGFDAAARFRGEP